MIAAEDSQVHNQARIQGQAHTRVEVVRRDLDQAGRKDLVGRMDLDLEGTVLVAGYSSPCGGQARSKAADPFVKDPDCLDIVMMRRRLASDFGGVASRTAAACRTCLPWLATSQTRRNCSAVTMLLQVEARGGRWIMQI